MQNQSFHSFSVEDNHNQEENGAVNGEVVKPCDIIKITGKPENCQAAKEALEKLVPITIEVSKDFKVSQVNIRLVLLIIKNILGASCLRSSSFHYR